MVQGCRRCLHREFRLEVQPVFSAEQVTQSDNYWLNTRTPCLTYGLRGIAYYKINVSGPGADLHSGVFGRMVHEPMTDLVLLMSKLVDPNGKILVPGVDDMVASADAEERYVFDDPLTGKRTND